MTRLLLRCILNDNTTASLYKKYVNQLFCRSVLLMFYWAIYPLCSSDIAISLTPFDKYLFRPFWNVHKTVNTIIR
jgi:hypothetical protein